jgi:Putative Ig domain
LAIDDQFFTCANGVCDVGAGSNVFVNNFFTTTFEATGGTSPYTWSGQPPAGLTLRPSGLLLGAPTTLGGPQTFTVTVTDASRATATGTFSLTVNPAPAPSPPGCQTGGKFKEPLSGPSFNGQTPTGTAFLDETQFGCGGFSTLSVAVKRVNLPNGSQLWVTLDFNPVGVITLSRQSGTMPTYNLGDFAPGGRDTIRVYSSLPDLSSFQQILIGP